jgi:carbamate kinase
LLDPLPRARFLAPWTRIGRDMRTAVLALGWECARASGRAPDDHQSFRHARNSVARSSNSRRMAGHRDRTREWPQVGDELVRNEVARKLVEPLPWVSGGEHGRLDWVHAPAIAAERPSLRPGRRDVITLITQTLVDPYDPALSRPTKPIGQRSPTSWRRSCGRPASRSDDDGAGHWRRSRRATADWPGRARADPSTAGARRHRRGGRWRRAAGLRPSLAWLRGLEAVVDKDRVAQFSRASSTPRSS